jgi:hypothetical protein
MAAWPALTELKRTLGATSDARDAELTRALAAAIEGVATDIGYTSIDVDATDPEAMALSGSLEDDDDGEPVLIEVVPSHRQAQAALLLAVTTMKAPDAPFGVAAVFDSGGIYVARQNPNYLKLLHGSRLRFGIA